MDLLIMEARPVRDVMRRPGWRVLAAVHPPTRISPSMTAARLSTGRGHELPRPPVFRLVLAPYRRTVRTSP